MNRIFREFLLVFAVFYPPILHSAPLVETGSAESITWPVLPGESLDRLASRFYPNNTPMQRQFIIDTLELSREQNPGLSPVRVFKHVAVVTIPELKSLSLDVKSLPSATDVSDSNPSNSKASRLRLSYQLHDLPKPSAASLIPPAMKVEYEDLLKRDQALKQELQAENERVASLQKTLQATQQQVRPKAETALAQATTNAMPPLSMAQAGAFITTEKPGQKSVLIQKLSPFFNLLLALTAVLVLSLLLWHARRRRERKLASLTELNTFMYDTLAHARPMDTPLSHDKSEEVNLSSHADEVVAIEAAKPEGEKVAEAEEEEAESVIASASMLMGLGKPKQAQVLLEAFLQEQPQQSVYPWLYLLDIHRSLHQKTEFLALLNRLHDNFNVVLPQWEETNVDIVLPSSLEEFPHIMKQLQQAWGSPEAAAYLKSLMLDRREGERVGFSLQVLQEIAILLKVAEIRDQF
ncbi:MAG: hypothetical protein ACXW1P_07155 [Methylophilaceae bacterium]